ncbi:hypothetical protein [Botryobacter ruber]|uniref:hypothetical protein n=1 Tax=Botryobacter ruber TaxID=2171629 RepID=UPI0013E32F61|nr:hypothetical protein [Botryobacter ruber]
MEKAMQLGEVGWGQYFSQGLFLLPSSFFADKAPPNENSALLFTEAIKQAEQSNL